MTVVGLANIQRYSEDLVMSNSCISPIVKATYRPRKERIISEINFLSSTILLPKQTNSNISVIVFISGFSYSFLWKLCCFLEFVPIERKGFCVVVFFLQRGKVCLNCSEEELKLPCLFFFEDFRTRRDLDNSLSSPIWE